LQSHLKQMVRDIGVNRTYVRERLITEFNKYTLFRNILSFMALKRVVEFPQYNQTDTWLITKNELIDICTQ
jgi:hypothetical protein